MGDDLTAANEADARANVARKPDTPMSGSAGDLLLCQRYKQGRRASEVHRRTALPADGAGAAPNPT